MKFRENCRYAIVVPTSMGVRICPMNGQPVQSSDTFFMQATSAESNVISISSYLGLKTKVLTTFVKDSPIADFIKRNLRSRGIDYEGVEVDQGGPWGYRHQFNIADSGYGSRGPRVCNDRAGEVGRTLNIKDFDTDRIFGEDFAQLFFSVLPEGSTVVQVKGNSGAVLLCGSCQFQTEFAGFRGQSADQTGEMQDLYAFYAEDTFYVEILDVQGTSYFACTVIAYAGTSGAVTAVCDVELVTITPGTALFYFSTFIVDAAGTKVALDEVCDGAVLYEGGQNLGLHTQVGSNGNNIGFRAGCLHKEGIGSLYRLTVHGADSDTHGGGYYDCILTIFTNFHNTVFSCLLWNFSVYFTAGEQKVCSPIPCCLLFC